MNYPCDQPNPEGLYRIIPSGSSSDTQKKNLRDTIKPGYNEPGFNEYLVFNENWCFI